MSLAGLLRGCLAPVILLAISTTVVAAPTAEYWALWDVSDEANLAELNHSQWDQIVQRFAVLDEESGIVSFSYGDLTKADLKSIEAYVDAMAKIDPRKYPKLEQQAYWMNLYNALTVIAVHENYDSLSQAKFQNGLPEGAWNKKRVKVAKQSLTLNDIEHRILRPVFKDHRILFGLNCTTLDCPNLSVNAYTGKTVKAQLKAAGVRFINNNIGLRYADGILYASRLFQDYAADFAEDEKTLKKVFAHYAADMKALYALGYTGTINYTRDSRLNVR